MIFNGERVEVDPSLHLENLRKELASRKYSPKTIKAYIYYNDYFLKFVKKDVYPNHVRIYYVKLNKKIG
jgi:hypothetical protein